MSEDDEGKAPEAPRPRGPRVVTGDMLRGPRPPRVVTGRTVSPPPATGDESTETLVSPAAPPPPPPSTPSSPAPVTRRPRMTARPAPPVPEPEVAPEVEDDEPAPWRPIEVTRTLPPSVHRSASASSPTPSPGRGDKPAGRGAGTAFALALASLVLAGLTAIPALIAAGRANKRGGRPGLITAARVVAVLSLAAWLAVAGVAVANLAKPDGVDYAKLQAGDCIDTPEGTEVRRLKVRDCDEPHDAEVFAVIVHPAGQGDPFPGATALLEYAANLCLGQPFTDYVGIPRGQSQLTEFEIVPESEAWAAGRRGLVCAVDNADRSPLTASVRGSGR